VLDARGADVLEAVRAELATITTVSAIAGDVNDLQHRAALVEAAIRLGGLDVLVNNAGTLGMTPRPDLLDYPLDALTEVYQTNVIAPLALIQAARDTLKANARIVNITSDAAAEAYAGWGGYGSSKAALEQLGAILGAENPQWRVYTVDPGDMRTQMHQDAFPGEDISDRDLPEASVPGLLRLLTENFPSGRYRAKALETPPVLGLRVALTVPDFEKAVAFYRDGLGLPVVEQWISETSKGILLNAGAATLELFNETQAAEVDQIEVGKRAAGQVRFAFIVKDVAQSAQDAIHAGATPISAQILTPWQDLNQRLELPEVQPNIQITLSQDIETDQEADQKEVETAS
jgi:NAD(P)-dependent dehydrogenase (short-subunit alcohol dehydrogenase family)